MRTDLFYIQPTFARGMARSFDLWGKLDDCQSSLSAHELDSLAIASDFMVVGKDLTLVMQAKTKADKTTPRKRD